jgi:hypothetical protein
MAEIAWGPFLERHSYNGVTSTPFVAVSSTAASAPHPRILSFFSLLGGPAKQHDYGDC